MGQILNIEIKDDGYILANAYYRWLGYTKGALELTDTIMHKINEINCENKIIKAIKLFECTGAGLTADEKKYGMSKIRDFDKFEFKDATGRGNGLISISTSGIEETENYEEARVEIDLSTKKIYFGVYYVYKTEQEYSAECDEDDEEYNNLPEYTNVDLGEIPFSKFTSVKNELDEIIDSDYRAARTNDSIICFV